MRPSPCGRLPRKGGGLTGMQYGVVKLAATTQSICLGVNMVESPSWICGVSTVQNNHNGMTSSTN